MNIRNQLTSGLSAFVEGTGLATWKTPSHPAIADRTES